MCSGCTNSSKGIPPSEEGLRASDDESVTSVLPRRAKQRQWKFNIRMRPLFKRRTANRTSVAIILLFTFGLLPAFIWFGAIPKPFTPKPISCGSHKGPLDSPKNNTSTDGVESFFTIDRTMEGLPFGVAKTIDLVWDILIARGMFFFALWVSYKSFSSSLLRALELSPIPYDTFVGISLNGPTVWSTYWVFKDFYKFRMYRMKFWFFVIGLGMLYVFAIPTLFTAISGYIVDTSSFTTIPGTVDLVHTSAFTSTNAIFQNDRSNKSYCLDDTSGDWKNLLRKSKMQMSCCTPIDCTRQYDGRTLSSNLEWGQVCPSSALFSVDFPSKTDWQLTSWQGSECSFYGNASFLWTDTAGIEWTDYCSQSLTVEILNQTFRAWGPLSSPSISVPSQKCYANRAYMYDSIAEKVQCLPESHPKYRWGFSTRLTSIAILTHMTWSILVFALWLEAEMHGTLQEEGFELNQLRSAFVLTKAAEITTGRCADWLLNNHEETKRSISEKDARVGFEVLRRRTRAVEDDVERDSRVHAD